MPANGATSCDPSRTVRPERFPEGLRGKQSKDADLQRAFARRTFASFDYFPLVYSREMLRTNGFASLRMAITLGQQQMCIEMAPSNRASHSNWAF